MNRLPAPDLAFDGFEEQRRIARRRRKRVLLPIIIVCAMLAALVTIALYNYRMMRSDALALSKGVIVNLQSRIETEMNAFLGHIPGLARLSRDLFANVPSDGPPRALAEAQGIGMLNGNPQLTAFFVGTETGQFLMVRRFAMANQVSKPRSSTRRRAQKRVGRSNSLGVTAAARCCRVRHSPGTTTIRVSDPGISARVHRAPSTGPMSIHSLPVGPPV